MKTTTLKQKRINDLNRFKQAPVVEPAKRVKTRTTKKLLLEIKHILVPTDFSENSLHALKLAENLAKATGAQLTLLHVVELVPILPVPESFTPMAIDQPRVIKIAQKKLEALPSAYGIDARLIGRTVVRVGIPWNEIVATAKDLNRDLIVIATHGFTGWKHVLMGSTAERVVRHARAPGEVSSHGVPPSGGPGDPETLTPQSQSLMVGRAGHGESNLNPEPTPLTVGRNSVEPNLNGVPVKVPKPRSKIARLPKDIQTNLNSMLARGCPYAEIIRCLNDHGYPGFNKVNLHNWRITGFNDWLRTKGQATSPDTDPAVLEAVQKPVVTDRR